jgi:CPA1 family monovalent cation:H+ antiporter
VESAVVQILLIVVGATVLSGLARKFRISAPIVLVLAGVGVSFVPFVPDVELNSDLVLLVFLPPLLYSAALESSYVNLKANLRPILQLSIGLVLFTTVAVAFTMHWVVGLPLAVAFVLGAVVAPPDAVAATAIGRSLGLPRRVLTILGGESLLNDATALTAFRISLVAAVAGGFSLREGVIEFLVASIGGVLLAAVLAPFIHKLRVHIVEPVLENSFSLLVPFAAYLLAESMHASGVLTVVFLGLYLGHHEAETSFAARLQARAIWKMTDFLLESVVFALIGLQALPILRGARDELGGIPMLVTYGLLVFGVVVLARIVWIFPNTYLPRKFSARLAARDPSPPWQAVAVLSWAGMRGVVSLAAAFAIPAVGKDGKPFPDLDVVLYLTLCVVLGTLVVQGLTLPWLIRRLGVVSQESSADVLAEAQVQHAAARAGVDRLDQLLSTGDDLPDGVTERLRQLSEHRANGAWDRLGSLSASGEKDDSKPETPADAFRRVRREMLVAERQIFVQMRNSGQIDDEVLRRVMNEMDLEEAMLVR